MTKIISLPEGSFTLILTFGSMKYLILGLVWVVLIQCKSSIPADSATSVKIVLDTEEPLAESDTIYLTGNQKILGTWNPKALAMNRRSETRLEKTFDIDSAHLEFKFTLGSYDQEAISNRGVVPSNSIIHAVRDTEVYFVIEDWKNPENEKVTTSYGKLETFTIEPLNGVKARKIHVLLPKAYDQNNQERFPVIYLHDGQNQFDSTKSFLRQEWKIDENIAALESAGKITAPICVAIENSDKRSEEYGDVNADNKYLEFIVKQLKPRIDSAYHTLPDRKNTATMGSSLGGLVAFSLAWHYNDLFSKAACLSPAFKYRSIDMVKKVQEYTGPKKDLTLYFDNGTLGLEKELQPGLDEMKKTLESNGYKMEYKIEKNAEHNETAWAKRIAKPLTMFFAK